MSDPPVIYMDPLPANTGVIYMDPLPKNTGVIYMDPKEPDKQWYFWGSATFPASAISTTFQFVPGGYFGGYQTITFKGATTAKIVWNSGAYYRGAVLNDWRTAIGFKSQIDTAAVGDQGMYSSYASAIAAAQGTSAEISIGDDGIIYNGAMMASLPADRSGSVTFDIYYLKST